MISNIARNSIKDAYPPLDGGWSNDFCWYFNGTCSIKADVAEALILPTSPYEDQLTYNYWIYFGYGCHFHRTANKTATRLRLARASARAGRGFFLCLIPGSGYFPVGSRITIPKRRSPRSLTLANPRPLAKMIVFVMSAAGRPVMTE